jgi:predicted PhzF superfamily epimerase YddE/YHI9
VRDLRPDLTRLRAVDARGIIVTSRSDNADRDFVSRFFAPSVGIAEDPVTDQPIAVSLRTGLLS